MNGGLCGTAAAWRGFANGSQFSAASRPWMPVPGVPGPAGPEPYLARYALPTDGAPEAAGRWYSFRVGTVVFACLDSADVTSGSSGSAAQTRWLERTLAQARADASVDWIIISSHHAACSSAAGWLPGHPRGVAAAARPVRGGPPAVRPWGRLRAVLPLPGSRPAGLPPAGIGRGDVTRRAAPGRGDGRRDHRHQPGHRAPCPRIQRGRPRGGWRARHGHRAGASPGGRGGDRGRHLVRPA